MSELVERLKNKISYYIYKTVNDDEANEFANEKKEKEKENLPIKEEYDDNSAKNTLSSAIQSSDKSTTDDPNKIDIQRILTTTVDKVTYFIKTYIYVLLIICVASFVANELIIYPAGVRFIFFVFTIVICWMQNWIAVAMGSYYIGKKAYEKYINRERKEKPDPPIRLMPKIFAFLPLMVKDPNASGILEFFKYPFQYLKEDVGEDTNEFKQTHRDVLDEIMNKYQESLKNSFPYYENVKDEAIFKLRTQEFNEHLSKMHLQLEKEVEETPVNTLPPTINATKPAINRNAESEQFLKEVKEKQNRAATFFAPQSATIESDEKSNTLPPTIEPIAKSNTLPATIEPVAKSNVTANTLPATIKPDNSATAETNQTQKFLNDVKEKQNKAATFFAPQKS